MGLKEDALDRGGMCIKRQAWQALTKIILMVLELGDRVPQSPPRPPLRGKMYHFI